MTLQWHTRADFWALAGIYAVDTAIETTNEVCGGEESCTVPESGLVFQYGRQVGPEQTVMMLTALGTALGSAQDCTTSPNTDDDVGLPSATLGYDNLMNYFDTEFGFDVNETVALMGAHTLGKATTDNSGFKGAWISGATLLFNNDFYKVSKYLLTRFMNTALQKLTDSSLTWLHRDNTASDDTRHWQWNARLSSMTLAETAGNGVAFMLNTDMALYKDIQVDDDGKSSCDFETCDASATATAVEAFAASNEVWVQAFAKVYTKMLAHGTTELYDVLEA
jgi:catalase (peroxidase I)